MAQVSVNITDFETTPIHVVYEEACKDAKVCRFIHNHVDSRLCLTKASKRIFNLLSKAYFMFT